MNFFIQIKNLYKSYFQNNIIEIPVIKDLNLEIKSGEFLSLMGPSGSGKSTLLNCIGLLDKFVSGKFKILNKDYSLLTESEITNIRLNDIGFVFQNHRLFPEFSALENIIIPSLIKNIPFDEAKKKAIQILTYLNLEHRINHRPAKLSGGESQRVAIGRALSNNPKFILADEPTGNLDKDNTLLIFNILKKITLDTEKSCIIATHNNFLAEKMDRIFLIENQNIKILK